MSRKKDISYVDAALLEQAERDLASIPQGKISRRLLAIISAGLGKPIVEIAEFFRVSRQSIYFWIIYYKREGLDGLCDRPKGHRQKRLSPAQERQIASWISKAETSDGQQIHWTIDKVKAAIQEQFGVKLSRSRVGVLMHEWGFRSKVPRPKHKKSDEAEQEAFKKTSRKGE